MYVDDLVSLLDPAELTTKEPIPIPSRRLIDIAIRPAAGI
jgi:hypothetical protein